MSLFVSSKDSEYNKQRCEELRLIRKDLADKLGVGYKIRSTPCEFKGKCKGTCPACEAEEKILLDALYMFNSNKGIKITNTLYENMTQPDFKGLPFRTPGVPAPYNYGNIEEKMTNKTKDKECDMHMVMGEASFEDDFENSFKADNEQNKFIDIRPMTLGIPAPPQPNSSKWKINGKGKYEYF